MFCVMCAFGFVCSFSRPFLEFWNSWFICRQTIYILMFLNAIACWSIFSVWTQQFRCVSVNEIVSALISLCHEVNCFLFCLFCCFFFISSSPSFLSFCQSNLMPFLWPSFLPLKWHYMLMNFCVTCNFQSMAFFYKACQLKNHNVHRNKSVDCCKRR